MLDLDHRAVVSQADLIYQSPVANPVEGQPIGNGNMGTLVWTTPNTINFQINRSDVFAVNKNHTGQQGCETDYGGGCARIMVHLGGSPFHSSDAFEQRLTLTDAEVSMTGDGVRARCFISAVDDLLALQVDDQRAKPQPLRLTVSMWRPPVVKTGEHVARWEFRALTDRVCVIQRFDEKDYHCASAVAVQVVGSEAQVEASDDSAQSIIVPAKEGKTTILISSAASQSLTRGADVGETAMSVLEKAANQPYDALRGEHTRWWSRFWKRTFVQIESKDGLGEFMARVRNLHLYYMAATSRGTFPPKWNGSLFITEGDTRHWGTQYWVWTTEMLYFPLYPADAIDLTEPYFNMYLKHLPDCERAAQQRWGVAGGTFFPETTPFDGPVVLPDDVALEVQDLLFGHKPLSELSQRAYRLCQFDSHLRVITNPHLGRYSWISHVASSGSEIAIQAWWRYRYTGDTEWLGTHAYPLLRGTVEFYSHLVKKDDDGCYHIYGTNAHEDFWGVKDGIMDLAAIRGTTPLAICAAEILGVDADLCAKWKNLLDNLAPYPMGSDEESKALAASALADDVWAAGHLGDVDGQHNPEDVWLNPVFPFEDWTLETRHPTLDTMVHKAIDLAPRHLSILDGAKTNTAIRTPIAATRAGRGEELPAILASYYAAFRPPLPNGMSLFEGHQAHSIEHLGCLTTVLQEGLLQSLSSRPGEPEVISVFPAWPKAWNASFRLLARGGFMVTAAVDNGEVAFVELESRLGETCQMRNPWPCACRVIELEGDTHELDGEILRFNTKPGKRYQVLPKGKPQPEPRRISPRPTTEPASYSLTMPNGTTVHQGILGRRK